MVVSLLQQSREELKNVSVGWQQWLQVGNWCFRSAVLMDPHQKSLRFCLCAQRIEITDALIFRNGKSGAMGLSPFAPYKSPLKRNQFSSLDSASKAVCLHLLFSPGL